MHRECLLSLMSSPAGCTHPSPNPEVTADSSIQCHISVPYEGLVTRELTAGLARRMSKQKVSHGTFQKLFVKTSQDVLMLG